MAGNTLTRAMIAEVIHLETGLPRNDTSNLVESIIDLISDALREEEIVKITSFARFEVKHKRERIGRNPKTKIDARIKPRKVVSFRASTMLKSTVNRQFLKEQF
ncbi:MAG: integration host factor subunit alpha [Alphaproteobacteria bacterium]